MLYAILPDKFKFPASVGLGSLETELFTDLTTITGRPSVSVLDTSNAILSSIAGLTKLSLTSLKNSNSLPCVSLLIPASTGAESVLGKSSKLSIAMPLKSVSPICPPSPITA